MYTIFMSILAQMRKISKTDFRFSFSWFRIHNLPLKLITQFFYHSPDCTGSYKTSRPLGSKLKNIEEEVMCRSPSPRLEENLQMCKCLTL